MQYRLRREFRGQGRNPDLLSFHLFERGTELLPTHNARVRAALAETLSKRGVHVHLDSAVCQVDPGQVSTRNGKVPLDEILWVTRAAGPAWLRDTGLALDDDGFILCRATLQTETDDNIFASGDIASVTAHPREKAGVFAVRQGPPLADNLRRTAVGRKPRPFVPQTQWLALISTGDRYAIASRGQRFARGRLLWYWKDWIDRRFMRRFNDLLPMKEAAVRPDTAAAGSPEDAAQALSAVAMRCGGCGARCRR